MNIDKFTITSYDRLMGFDRSTGKLDMILDELSDFTLSHEEEKVDITGKGGRTITSLKKNKKVTGKGTNGMLSGGALAAALGADVENGSYRIRFTDTVAVNANKGVTQKTAVGTAGNEIGTIYVKDSANASLSESRKLVQTSEAPSKAAPSLTTLRTTKFPSSPAMSKMKQKSSPSTIRKWMAERSPTTRITTAKHCRSLWM